MVVVIIIIVPWVALRRMNNLSTSLLVVVVLLLLLATTILSITTTTTTNQHREQLELINFTTVVVLRPEMMKITIILPIPVLILWQYRLLIATTMVIRTIESKTITTMQKCEEGGGGENVLLRKRRYKETQLRNRILKL